MTLSNTAPRPALQAASAVCSCGTAEDHVIARRQTADGKALLLWSDGSLTWALGHAVKGSAYPRTAEQRSMALRAGWLVLGEVCLYEADEVSRLVAAARWVAARGGLPGDVRARLRAQSEQAGIKLTWTIVQADRDGKPTVRVSRLPRIAWPGMAVWNERGRYDVVREINTGTFESTGFSAKTIRGLNALLATIRVTIGGAP